MQKSQEQLNNPLLPLGEGAQRADEGAFQKNPHPNPLPKGEGDLRVALVHDFLLYPGGAERVLEVLAEMFPEAPIYTLLYNKEKMKEKFADKEIKTSFLQKFPKFFRKRYKYLLPFMPTAPETFDLRDFDLVISSSGAWSKGIVAKLDTIHIAYIHSPMRFVWDYNERYLEERTNNLQLTTNNFFTRILLSYLRIWDREAADRPDYLVANSKYTQERIEKYYRRESAVIYPPVSKPLLPLGEGAPMSIEANEGVSQNRPHPSPLPKGEGDRGGGYFLVVSRLSPYKKADLVVEAFNKLELPLVVIGEGKQYRHLKKIAGKNIRILGWQKDEKLAEYYANARAFVFPAEDDFGLAPMEAMSYGVPVIAYRKGGATEIVIEGVTGEFFDAQTPEVLADGVRRFMEKEKTYDKEIIKKRAREFSRERFKKELLEFIKRVLKSEARNPKPETNSNDQNSNVLNI